MIVRRSDEVLPPFARASSLLRASAYACLYADNRARAIALPAFVDSYTHRCPHGELGGLSGMQRFVNDVRGHYS